MSGRERGDPSIQAYFTPSPTKPSSSMTSSSDILIGDGFTTEEIKEASKPKPARVWHPPEDYAECDIRDLLPGPRPVSFMGRIANIFDAATTPKTPRSAKGCFKLCVKDDTGTITIRLLYSSHFPDLRLGALVSVWTKRVSDGENATLSGSSTPMFVSLFPERDQSCHIMVHDSDDRTICVTPLGYRQGCPLAGVMTLENFVNGGYDVVDAKILVVVKSIGARKKVTRQDGSMTENVNVQVHDDTAEATLGIWGTATLSPLDTVSCAENDTSDLSTCRRGWKPGETVLLIQAPGWKIGGTTYLSFTNATKVDVDPAIPDTDWLRRWSLRQKCREAINPPFPIGIFDYDAVKSGPVRCLFTIADLDEFARTSPSETFQGYLSLLITDFKLLEYWKKCMLFSNECCNMPIYANAITSTCKGCGKEVALRLNPRILAQVIDETAAISSGKLLFSDRAWRDLLGRAPEDLLKLRQDELKDMSDQILFCRISVMFGWAGDESKAGRRICVMGVYA